MQTIYYVVYSIMENTKPEPKKKEDKRRQICLENLRKGREKLQKLRQKGFSTRIPIKGKIKIKSEVLS